MFKSALHTVRNLKENKCFISIYSWRVIQEILGLELHLICLPFIDNPKIPFSDLPREPHRDYKVIIMKMYMNVYEFILHPRRSIQSDFS